MRLNVVLIDFESVQPASLAHLVAECFEVKMFVGATQAKLSFELADAMQRLGRRAEYIRISGVGRNALDFHIAYYIGRIAAEMPETYFHIVSKDTGFDPLVQHLKEKNILCARSESIEDIPAVKAGQAKSPEERATLFLSRLLKPKATKPRTEKTLRSAISAHFQQKLSEAEISAIVDALRRLGDVCIADGKVVYATAG